LIVILTTGCGIFTCIASFVDITFYFLDSLLYIVKSIYYDFVFCRNKIPVIAEVKGH